MSKLAFPRLLLLKISVRPQTQHFHSNPCLLLLCHSTLALTGNGADVIWISIAFLNKTHYNVLSIASIWLVKMLISCQDSRRTIFNLHLVPATGNCIWPTFSKIVCCWQLCLDWYELLLLLVDCCRGFVFEWHRARTAHLDNNKRCDNNLERISVATAA